MTGNVSLGKITELTPELTTTDVRVERGIDTVSLGKATEVGDDNGSVSLGNTTELKTDTGTVSLGNMTTLVTSVAVETTGITVLGTGMMPVLVRVVRMVVSAAEEMMVVRKVVGMAVEAVVLIVVGTVTIVPVVLVTSDTAIAVVMAVFTEGTVSVATSKDVISEVAIDISTLVVGGSLNCT